MPPASVSNRFGVDYVKVQGAAAAIDVPVIIGETFESAEGPRVEILSGLNPGDRVLVP